MTQVIQHRGPDDDGSHLAPGVALGMRRLSIIDLPGGHQPLANEDGSVHTVFNGEIYNYRELREDLAARGHTLATSGDTETIVHAYEEWGLDFPRRLRGMFGIALWDAKRRRGVLVRDRMGIKPLYVAETPAGLAFASEVKSLVAGGLVRPALDPLAAELFMAYGYVPGPRTLFEGVRKLPPASMLVWEDGAGRESTWWSAWDERPDGVGRSWQEDEERFMELLRRSVRAEMVSDVPLGAMLSGGIDSSVITALMAEASSQPVRTFAVGFEEDADSNELGPARRVAQRFGTEHHELLTSAVDHPGLLDETLWHMEEPIADLSNLGFLLLCRLAREHVTVALAGQGADELLGGYRKHQIAALADRAGRPGRAVAGLVAGLAPEGSTTARGLAAIGAREPAARLLAMSRVLGAHEREALLEPAFAVDGAERAIAAAVADRAAPRELSALAETLHLDSRLALPDLMLLYFDKMSMAASLEVRVPFLDPALVAFCTALPDSRRVLRGRRKELLRRACRGLLDDETIDRKKRAFFRNALGAWVRVQRDDVLRGTLLDERTRERGQFRPQALAGLVEAAEASDLKASQRLFCALMLEKWQRLWVDGDGRAAQLAAAAPAPV